MGKQINSETRMSNAISLPPEKRVYFNGFVVNMSASDIVIALELNNEPVILLNTSFPIAKAFVEILGETIANFEKGAEIKIPQLKTIERKLKKLNAEEK